MVKIMKPTPKRSPMGRGKAAGDPNDRVDHKPSMPARPEIAGIGISHPERIVYPESGLTKLDLARYYESVADLIMPFVGDRPLSTVRCPEGLSGQCFFQKHIGSTFTDPVHSITIVESTGIGRCITIDSIPGLIALVQFGVMELHPWGSRNDTLDNPDLIVFDLDPGEVVGFDAVKQAAVRVREELEDQGLKSFVKTSGGKGLHVVVPLRSCADWDQAKQFSQGIAAKMARDEPDRYTASLSKAKRIGKIFVDYLRNTRGATSVAPYSTRSRPRAPVSMPLSWADLRTLRSADQFTVQNIPQHLRDRGPDPWKEFFKVRQDITAANLRSLHGSPPPKPPKAGRGKGMRAAKGLNSHPPRRAKAADTRTL